MRLGGVRFVAVVAASAMVFGGCDAGGDDGPPPPDAGERARERVQAYLDAVKAKDVPAGRAQLCTGMQATFDRLATSPNGDFADHFTVSDAAITGVRAEGDGQRVDAALTIDAAGQVGQVGLVFTVAEVDGQWCISAEAPGTAPSSDPARPEPSPSEPTPGDPAPDDPAPGGAD